MDKIRFTSDYICTAHPAVLKAFVESYGQTYAGYSTDEVCKEAADLIRQYVGRDSAVHFLVGGTQANVLGLQAGLTRPHYSVICPTSGHINAHESGSVEATGHKLQQIPSINGKITAEQIAAEAEAFRTSSIQEHITEPRMVYISLPTEYGTTYNLAELTAIREVCDEYGLYFFIDGARLGYALAAASCDVTMEDLGRLADAFYAGGTKCGAMFGEALIINNPELNEGFRNLMKLHGAMLAKGWTLGLQFRALFTDGLYFDITRHAVELADQINEAFAAKGIERYMGADTNQLFYVLTDEQIAKLDEGFYFEEQEFLGPNRTVVRFCTGWNTTQQEADALIAAVQSL